MLTGSHQLIKKIFNSEYLNIGSGISPFNAWLLIRGLRTLPVRLEKITNTTLKVISFLKSQQKIDKVIFPLDDGFEQYDLAQQQMRGACGLITFTLKNGTVQSIEQFCDSLHHILKAVSWGGHESLIIPKCAGIPVADFDPKNIQHQFIRMYAGLEDPHYLIADLDQALSKI